MRKTFTLALSTFLVIAFCGAADAGLFGLFGGGQGGGKPKNRTYVDMGNIGTFDYSVFQYDGNGNSRRDTNPHPGVVNMTPDLGEESVGGYQPPRMNDPAPVPEPATLLLLGSGLAGLAWIGRRRNK